MRDARRTLIVALAGVAALTALAVLAPAAQAHPSGPPPIAELAVDGREVTVVWTAEPDDVTALAATVGALPQRQVFEVAPDGTVEQVSGDDLAASLGESTALPEYVGERIVVSQEGVTCPADLTEVLDPVADGLVVTAVCPEPVEEIDLAVTMLQDASPAYRTIARRVGGGRETLHTSEDPVASWSFASEQGGAGLDAVAVAPVAGLAAALAAVAGVVLMGRRRA